MRSPSLKGAPAKRLLVYLIYIIGGVMVIVHLRTLTTGGASGGLTRSQRIDFEDLSAAMEKELDELDDDVTGFEVIDSEGCKTRYTRDGIKA